MTTHDTITPPDLQRLQAASEATPSRVHARLNPAAPGYKELRIALGVLGVKRIRQDLSVADELACYFEVFAEAGNTGLGCPAVAPAEIHKRDIVPSATVAQLKTLALGRICAAEAALMEFVKEEGGKYPLGTVIFDANRNLETA